MNTLMYNTLLMQAYEYSMYNTLLMQEYEYSYV